MAIENETPEQQGMRLQLERIVGGVAKMVGSYLPPEAKIGFAVVLFDFGDKGNIAYASNGRREDMTKALRELLDKVLIDVEVDAVRGRDRSSS